ncbi:hypothetical protein GH714_035199 [Hevea brasiliensis]|uniref:Uncharacterized protein n=1 Tax=Hevea brasiliensis TaxID=3981 RepID=A0A6A6N6W5_HEVBR|nr:hypothetical protein GH714_035199 [Hevea brasiliensis]
MKGCKLILTTSSLDVCRGMGCQKTIKVVSLSKFEAWQLLQDKLERPLSPEVMEIAKSIARECAGLPLGIITIAASMRGADDICEWRNALRELQESQAREGDMENEVFQVLKFSYNRLTNSALQQCFLYNGLYPEDHNIDREEVMDNGYVRMHDLLRDMAIQIMEVDPQAFVKAAKELVEMPEWRNWPKDLVRALKKLDLYGSEVDELPQVIECLSNLSYLDLRHTNIEELQPGILTKFSHMQFLILPLFTVKGEEVAPWRKLETLKCHFYDVGEFNTYWTSTSAPNLSLYQLSVGQSKPILY